MKNFMRLAVVVALYIFANGCAMAEYRMPDGSTKPSWACDNLPIYSMACAFSAPTIEPDECINGRIVKVQTNAAGFREERRTKRRCNN